MPWISILLNFNFAGLFNLCFDEKCSSAALVVGNFWMFLGVLLILFFLKEVCFLKKAQ